VKYTDLATPWPFPFVPEDQLSKPLVKFIKTALRDRKYPKRDLDTIFSRNDSLGFFARSLGNRNALPLFNLLLAAKGCDLEGGYHEYRSFTSIGYYLAQLDINRILIAHPQLDLKNLTLLAAQRLFTSKPWKVSRATQWFDGTVSRIDEHRKMQRSCYQENSFKSFISYHALAYFTQHSFPTGNSVLSQDELIGLLDMNCSLEYAKRGWAALKRVEPEDSIYSRYRKTANYQDCLIEKIAPLAILMGHAPDAVALRVEQAIRFLWLELHDFNEDPEEFAANVRMLQMRLLWNHPEHWGRFGLVPADMLGVDCSFALLKKPEDGSQPATSSAMMAFWREGLIPKDGTGETFGKTALGALGEKHGLFDPKYILRRLGTSNALWFSKVKDFTPAIKEINFMMTHGEWHYALEKDRLSHLFGEHAALRAIQTYFNKGGNANKARAATSLEKYPQLLDQVLPIVSKSSQVPRLSALATLTPEQIMRLPEKLHAPLLAADLGL
jgi:hypothetical protein